MLKIAVWLIREKNLVVFVEPTVFEEEALQRWRETEHASVTDHVKPWHGAATDEDRSAALEARKDQEPTRSSTDRGPVQRIDFVISLGGDGTVLCVPQDRDPRAPL